MHCPTIWYLSNLDLLVWCARNKYNSYSLPNAGSEKNGDSSFFIRDRFRNKQKKHQKKKQIQDIENHWNIELFGLFGVFTHILPETNKMHRKKSGIFFHQFSTTPENCKLLWIGKNLAWASRGDMEKNIYPNSMSALGPQEPMEKWKFYTPKYGWNNP